MLATMPKDKPSKLPYRRDRSPALAALIKHVEAELTPQKGRGGIAWLARAVGVRKQALSRWDRVPLDRVPAVSRATGLPKYKIRPDVPDIFSHDETEPSKRRKSKAQTTAS